MSLQMGSQRILLSVYIMERERSKNKLFLLSFSLSLQYKGTLNMAVKDR